MKHINRSDHTAVIKGEREEGGVTVLPGVGDLSARMHADGGRPCITSHWQPDEDDLKILNEGGVVELDVLSSQTPPVRVSVVPGELEPGAEAAV